MSVAPGGTGTSAVTFFWKASSTICSNLSACVGAEPLVGSMRELLGLEADTGVKLYLEPLAGIRLDPLAVDALVLVMGPGILKCVQLKALFFQTSDVRPDALSVASLPVLEGVPDRVRYNRNGFFRRDAILITYIVNLLFEAVAAFQAVIESD